MSDQEKKIYVILGIGVLVLSTSGILIKLAEAPTLIIAFYRMLFSSLIFTPYILFKYRDRLNYFLDYRPAIVGLLLATHFFLWITALNLTSVANAVIFVAMQPLFTLLLEFIFAREDLREGVIMGLLLALVGSIIISIGDLGQIFSMLKGDLLALAAALFAAGYLFSGRSLRKEVDYLPYIYIVYTYAAIFLGLMIMLQGIRFTGYGQVNYLIFLGLALGPTLIGHSALNYSVRYVPTTIVSLSILGEPIFTTLLAWIILGEKVTLITIIGGTFILTGIYQATRVKESSQSAGAGG